MRALVTGSAGFIGSQIRSTLGEAGYRTDGLDVVNGTDVRYDLGDLIQRPGYYDVIVHCAAVVGGRRVMDWTPLKHAANLAIDAALFEWAEHVRPARVVYFSSSCAYPVMRGHQVRLLREDDIMFAAPSLPDQLYGWAKLTGERIALDLADAGVPVTVVRPFSVYGPGANEGFAVRSFAQQARDHADPIVIWGDDRQVRDYIHVTDVAAAVVALIRASVDGPVNLGTGRGTSLRTLARTCGDAAGYQPAVKVDESMPAGMRYLVADTTRLREFYTPQVTLEAGLAGIVQAAG